jgi:hypothetical protein
MASTSATTDSSASDSSGAAPTASGGGGILSTLGGLMRMADPQLLISVGAGLLSGARYGSNAGEGLMQGLQMYHAQKTSALPNQLQPQQIQEGQLGLQQRKMMLGAAQQAFQGDQGQPPAAGLMGGQPAQPPQSPQQPFLPGISPMPGDQPAQQPQAPPQGLPASLQPPSMAQIYGTTYPGGASPNYTRGMALLSQDPAAALLKARDDQLKLAQQQYAPTIAKLDTLIKSDTPSKYMKADPDLKAAWPQLAQTLGMDPDADYNDQNVRLALTHVRNQISSSLSEATEAPAAQWRTKNGPLGSVVQTNPVTGEQKEVVKPQPLSDVLVNGQPTKLRASAAEGQQPFNQVTYGSAQMAGAPGALLAAMASKGVSLPAGLRSQQQQVATLNGLMAANPGKSPDEIADMVRTGQLDFNGAKRSTGQLSGVLAAANAQSAKLEKDFAQIEPLVNALPNAPNTINRALVGLKNNLSFGGDKDSAQLVLYLREAATEYAKLSSGSTGAAAPAEGNIKDAVEIFHNAFTQGGYQGLKTAMIQSAQNKRDAYSEGLRTAAAPHFATGGPTSPNPGGTSAHPPDIQAILKKYGAQ